MRELSENAWDSR